MVKRKYGGGGNMGAMMKTRAVVVLGSKASPEESFHKDNCTCKGVEAFTEE